MAVRVSTMPIDQQVCDGRKRTAIIDAVIWIVSRGRWRKLDGVAEAPHDSNASQGLCLHSDHVSHTSTAACAAR